MLDIAFRKSGMLRSLAKLIFNSAPGAGAGAGARLDRIKQIAATIGVASTIKTHEQPDIYTLAKSCDGTDVSIVEYHRDGSGAVKIGDRSLRYTKDTFANGFLDRLSDTIRSVNNARTLLLLKLFGVDENIVATHYQHAVLVTQATFEKQTTAGLQLGDISIDIRASISMVVVRVPTGTYNWNAGGGVTYQDFIQSVYEREDGPNGMLVSGS